MRRHTLLFAILPLLCIALILAGCSQKPAAEEKPAGGGAQGASGESAKCSSHSHGEDADHEAPFQFSYEGKTLMLGNVYAREKRHATFTVKNVTGEPKTILEAFPTCDCIILDAPIRCRIVQPGEEVEVGLTMDASTVHATSFRREVQFDILNGKSFKAYIGGYILNPAVITPSDDVELGMMKNPAQPWSRSFHISSNPDSPETLVLGEPRENGFMEAILTKTGEGEYDLVVNSKAPFPYIRSAVFPLLIPVTAPAAADSIVINFNAQVGEAVVFAPDKWSIVRSKLEEAGSFTERFAYGEVPGLQEERGKGDISSDTRNMMNARLLRQHNAVPLRFVKEHHDWDDLFANLEFKVPEDVGFEKIRHPQGIELRITVTPKSFDSSDEIEIVPHRGANLCSPIKINVVE